MKRLLALFLAVILVFSVTACGDKGRQNEISSVGRPMDQEQETSGGGETVQSDEVFSNDENANREGADNESGILIAYFSAAENSGVDAVSSASYSMVNGVAMGRLSAVANMIQSETGGELFSIQTSVVYPADGGELIEYAAQEQDENARPELISHIENLDQYDTVFIGFPTWWYDMPQALYSFFDEYDFSGKTIIPFNVHNGSRFSGTIETIQELEPEAMIITDGFTVNERDVPDAAGDVADWLEGIGY